MQEIAAQPADDSNAVEGMICFFDTLRHVNATKQFLEHYHAERNHQGLENELIDPGEEVGRTSGAIQCRERLGGMLLYYYRDAA